MASVQDVVKRLTVVHTAPGADETRAKIKSVADAQREVANASATVERATLQSERAINQYVTRGVAMMRQAASAANDNFGQLAGTIAGIGVGFVGYLAITAALAAITKGAGEAIAAFQKFEDQQTRLRETLRATDFVSGQTPESIEKLVREIGDLNNARSAAQELLKFGNISGDVFADALRAANDLAGVFGGLQQATKGLGQALQDPVNGLTALESAGIRVSYSQQQVIKSLAESGRILEAQRAILAIVTDKVGGAGAARGDTLSGAYTAFSDAMQRGSEQFGETIAKTLRLAEAVQLLARGLNALNDFSFTDEAAKAIAFVLSPAGFLYSRLTSQPTQPTGTNQPLAQQAGLGDLAEMEEQRVKKNAGRWLMPSRNRRMR